MSNLINWLTERKYLSLLFLGIYYSMVVLPHEQVGLLVVDIFKGVSRDVYQITVASFGLFIFIAFFYFVVKSMQNHEKRSILFLYAFITIVLMLISFKYLIIHNIEIVHYAQYALLVAFLYPLTRTITSSLFWATILGTIDESYQYFYLAPERTDYFDFNDIILNLLGAAIGLLWVYSSYQRNEGISYYKKQIKVVLMTMIIISVFVIIGMKTSFLSIYAEPGENSSYIVLVKVFEANFWTYIKHLDVRYHIVQPLEGTIIIIVLLAFYFLLEKFGLRSTNPRKTLNTPTK